MKANKSAVAPAAAISFDEFIFQEKNHLYGAYKLRKEYKKRLLVALFFMLILLTSAISLPYIMKFFEKPLPPKPINLNEPRVIEIVDIEKYIPPPPPEPKISAALINIIKTSGYQIVDTTNQKLIAMNEPVVPEKPIETGIIKEVPETTPTVFPADSIFFTVQEPATFEGGEINNFGKWVGQNINVDRISEGNLGGRIFLNFVLDKTGSITNLKVTRSFNKEVEKEVLRTIENAPKRWNPGRQNGNAVKQFISMSIFVKIES